MQVLVPAHRLPVPERWPLCAPHLALQLDSGLPDGSDEEEAVSGQCPGVGLYGPWEEVLVEGVWVSGKELWGGGSRRAAGSLLVKDGFAGQQVSGVWLEGGGHRKGRALGMGRRYRSLIP